jgi:rod shape-determining protein MreB
MSLVSAGSHHFLDWGSAEVRWSNQAGTAVFREPNYSLERRSDQAVLAVGTAAARFVGRVPEAAEVYRPFSAGLPADLGVAGRAGLAVLTQLGWIESWWQQWFRTKTLVWAVPTITTAVERAWFQELAQVWGYRQVKLVPQSLAASTFWTNGQLTDTPLWVMDLGAEKTELGVIQSGMVVVGQTVRFGTSQLVAAIQTASMATQQIELSSEVAVQVLRTIGTLSPAASSQKDLTVMGRSLMTQLPVAVTIRAEVLQPYLITALQPLKTALDAFMATLPTLALTEVMHHGVALSGGGARLQGLDQWLKTQYQITCQQTKAPELVTLKGLVQL